MAQTVGSVCGITATFEVSTNGTTWTDISGSVTEVEDVEQTRTTDEAYTLDGDVAIICKGKREPIELKVNAVYTEVTSEAFEFVRPLFEAGTSVYARWAPKGKGATGNFVFNTANAAGAAAAVPISDFMYHAFAAEEAGPVLCSFTLKIPQIVKTSAASSTGLGS